jgi:hypothetical protein
LIIEGEPLRVRRPDKLSSFGFEGAIILGIA